MVAYPGVYICNECVALADAIIQEYKDKPVKLRLPPWESLNDDEMLDHIPRVAAAIDQVEADLRAWVQEPRRRSPGRGSARRWASPASPPGSGSPARTEIRAATRRSPASRPA